MPANIAWGGDRLSFSTIETATDSQLLELHSLIVRMTRDADKFASVFGGDPDRTLLDFLLEIEAEMKDRGLTDNLEIL